MSRIVIGSVVVAYEGAAADELLHRFEPAPDHAPARLVIEAPTQRAPLEATPAWRASFHQGELQAFFDGARMILRDGAAEIVVETGGSRIGVGVTASDERERSFFVERTLFAAVLVALRHHGLFHVHGGAVVTPEGRFFVVGSGGAGKSTTTLALLRDGGRWLGDDAVFLCNDGPETEARIVAFPKAFHAGARTIAAFPEIAPFVGAPYRAFSDKRAFEAAAAFPGRGERAMALPQVLLFPRIGSEASTRIAPLAPAEAHYRLVESSAFVLADGMAHRAEHLALLTRLVAAPAFEVELGSDALADPSGLGARLRALAP